MIESLKEMMEYLIFWKIIVAILTIIIIVLLVILVVLVNSYTDAINSFNNVMKYLETVIST
jgi:hypothetical protein